MSVLTLIQLPETYPIVNSQYFGKRIVRRTPYWMQGDLVVPASTSGRSFAEGTFTHNEDFPFEAMTLIPNITTLDSGGGPQLDPAIGDINRFVQLAIKLVGAARSMTKYVSRLSAILPKDSLVHDFSAPMYFERSQGFDISVNNAITSGAAAGGIRMEIGIVGNLLEF